MGHSYSVGAFASCGNYRALMRPADQLNGQAVTAELGRRPVVRVPPCRRLHRRRKVSLVPMATMREGDAGALDSAMRLPFLLRITATFDLVDEHDEPLCRFLEVFDRGHFDAVHQFVPETSELV